MCAVSTVSSNAIGSNRERTSAICSYSSVCDCSTTSTPLPTPIGRFGTTDRWLVPGMMASSWSFHMPQAMDRTILPSRASASGVMTSPTRFGLTAITTTSDSATVSSALAAARAPSCVVSRMRRSRSMS